MKKNKINMEISVVELPPDLQSLCLQRMARRLVMIIEAEEIPEIVRDAVYIIAENAVLNAPDSATRAEFIENRFVRAMKVSNPDYVAAIMHSLSSVMENCIDEAIYQPILDKSLGR